MDLEQASKTAAAAPPGMLDLGGQSFLIRPLTGPEKLSLGREMRKQVLAASRDPIAVVNEKVSAAEKMGRPLNPTVVQGMIDAALKASSRQEGKTEPSDDDIEQQFKTLTGARYFVWFWVSRTNKDVTAKDIADLLPDDDAVNDVYYKLTELSGLKEFDPKKASSTG